VAERLDRRGTSVIGEMAAHGSGPQEFTPTRFLKVTDWKLIVITLDKFVAKR